MSSDAGQASGPELPAFRRRPHATDEGGAERSRLTLVVPLVMTTAALVGLVLVGFESKGIYSKPVDEIVRQKSALVGRPLRAEGLLVHGSLTPRTLPGVCGAIAAQRRARHRRQAVERGEEAPHRLPAGANAL